MRALSLVLWLCAAAALAPACSPAVWPAPLPEAVEPSGAPAGVATDVVIRGRAFVPRVQADFGDARGSTLDGAFVASLGDTALADVRYVSSTELHAHIPGTLSPGRYALTVRAPGGGSGVLDAAFEVRPLAARRLAFTTPPRTLSAGGCSEPLVLQLQREDGTAVTLPHALDVQVGSAPAGALGLFTDAACTQGVDAVRFEAGQAEVALHVRSTRAGTHTARATSVLPAASQDVTVTSGAPATISWEPVAQQVAGTPFGVRASATDAHGNPVDVAAVLTPAPDAALGCVAGCDAEGLALFEGGVFQGRLALSAVRGVQVTATAAGATGSTNAFDVLAPPAALVFTTAAHALEAGGCSPPVRLELRDAGDAPAPSPAGTRVTFTRGGGLTVHADAACATGPLELADVPAGAAHLTLYVSSRTAGTASLAAASEGLTGDAQAYAVAPGPVARFAWEPVGAVQQRTVPFAVGARALDAFDNVARFTGAAALTSSSGQAVACSEGCAGPSAAAFTDGRWDGYVALSAPATGVRLVLTSGAVASPSDAFDVVELTSAPPARVAFDSAPRTAVADVCSAAVVLELRDAQGAATPAASPLGATVAVQPAGAVALWADAACTQPLGTLTFATGDVQRSFHFSGRVARTVTLVASAAGFEDVSQQATVVAAATAALRFDPVPSPQRRGADVPVTLRAVDAFGNPTPDFTAEASLAITPVVPLVCAAGCASATPPTTAAFAAGVWSGTVRVGHPVGMGRVLHATAGGVSGSSNPFEVVDPSRTPPLAVLARSPGVVRVGEAVTLDASGSRDVETAAADLAVSWDPGALASATAPWSPWSMTKTLVHAFTSAGLQPVRLAVRDGDGDVGYARTDVPVLPAGVEPCVVRVGTDQDNGATSCADPDLSLSEAVRLSNTLPGKQTITFATGLGVSFNRALTVTDDVDVVGAPGQPTVSNVQWNVESGRLLLSGLSFRASGSPRLVTVREAASAHLLDLVVEHYGEVLVYGQAVVERSRFLDCESVCVVLEDTAGDVRLAHSTFAGPGGNGVNLHGCGNGARHELVGNVFTTDLSKGIHMKTGCGSGPVVIANNTFVRMDDAVVMDGGQGHVLVNNVFAELDGEPLNKCGAGVFSQRDYNLVYLVRPDPCGTGAEPGSPPSADPRFVSAATGDFRLRPDSPARDRGRDLGQDLTPWEAGRYLGLAPDLGGVETW